MKLIIKKIAGELGKLLIGVGNMPLTEVSLAVNQVTIQGDRVQDVHLEDVGWRGSRVRSVAIGPNGQDMMQIYIAPRKDGGSVNIEEVLISGRHHLVFRDAFGFYLTQTGWKEIPSNLKGETDLISIDIGIHESLYVHGEGA